MKQHSLLLFVATTTLLHSCCSTRPGQAALDGAYIWKPTASTTQKTEDLNTLILSSGGRNGAWAAGFLKAWKDRPMFDLVTGVSGGALQATSAFIGTDAELERASKLWKDVRTADVYSAHSWLSYLFSCHRSFASTMPLRENLRNWFPKHIIDKVGSETERTLLISTYDIDSDSVVIWDMTKVASKCEYDLYREIIRASAAAPPMLEPVEIMGHLHADGAIVSRAFLRESSKALRPTAGQHNIYALLLRDSSSAQHEPYTDGVIGITRRELNKSAEAAMTLSIWQLAGQARGMGANFSYVRHEITLSGGLLDFNAKDMQWLVNQGEQEGANPNWKTNPKLPTLHADINQ